MWDVLYLVNFVFIFVSWKIATVCFTNGNKVGGWLNVFASALNAAIIVDHFV
jgi:hypothetical protein